MRRPAALMRIEVMDAKTCSTCRELHGVTAPVGSPVVDTLVLPLAHPNCRREVVELYDDELPEEYRDIVEATPPEIISVLGTLMPPSEAAEAFRPRQLVVERARELGYDDPIFAEWLYRMAAKGLFPLDPELREIVEEIRDLLEEEGLL